MIDVPVGNTAISESVYATCLKNQLVVGYLKLKITYAVSAVNLLRSLHV